MAREMDPYIEAEKVKSKADALKLLRRAAKASNSEYCVEILLVSIAGAYNLSMEEINQALTV